VIRRKPISRTRAKKRTWKTPRCLSRGCHQPQGPLSRCPKHRHKHLDDLWGARVRSGRCDIDHARWFRCGGAIQANHGFDRIDKGTRWDVANGISGCAAANAYFHIHKRLWYDLLRERWGDAKYLSLKKLADTVTHPDYDAIHTELGCDCELAKEAA